jgi:hypothetical protein
MFKIIFRGEILAVFSSRGNATTFCHQKGIPTNCIIEGVV